MRRDVYVVYKVFTSKAKEEPIVTVVGAYATEETTKMVVDKMNAYIESKTKGKSAANSESLVYYYKKVVLNEE